MKRTMLLVLAIMLVPQITPAQKPPAENVPATDKQLTPAEQKFTDQLTSAKLVGRYTTWENTDTPKKDTYTLDRVAKLEDDLWMFVARIQYGDYDVKLPLPLQVKWAGNTPVITLDKFPVPGFGTFSARIVIHNGQYAGTWDGGDHGGHMYGRIEKLSDVTKQPNDAEEKGSESTD